MGNHSNEEVAVSVTGTGSTDDVKHTYYMDEAELCKLEAELTRLRGIEAALHTVRRLVCVNYGTIDKEARVIDDLIADALEKAK